MKKTLVSALTTALVVGAASTTFAAANPFSDVPADSWAYNAVATLAKDGVVNGFPNGTFQGQKTMTRYEMAQIVAKAMAYENMTKADKAIVDKLAAEFADELNNLGVRVANLENKIDNVKLNGEVRYTYENVDWKDVPQDGDGISNELLFRLEPSAQVNDKWTAKARLDYAMNPSDDSDNDGKVEVDRIYMEGKVGNSSTVLLGKYPSFLANGLVFDSRLSGAAAVFGEGEKAQVTIAAGRYNGLKLMDDHDYGYIELSDDLKEMLKNEPGKDHSVDVYALQLDYHFTDKFSMDAGFMTLRGLDNRENVLEELFENYKNRDNIWFVGARAGVAPLLHLNADYAKGSLKVDKDEYDFESTQDKAYSVELAYRGEDPKDAGSYGIFAAYRNLGGTAAIAPTYDAIKAGQKGMEYGVAYVPAENVVTTVKYFDGKDLVLDKDVRTLWARAEFLF